MKMKTDCCDVAEGVRGDQFVLGVTQEGCCEI